MDRELKIARIRAGLTQQELARMLGIPENKWCKIETGRIVPRPDVLYRAREHLHMKQEDPKGGDDQ